MDKVKAKKILSENLKGKKKKQVSLLTIAEAVRLLANDKEYGSTSKLAESFGVKRPTIESFDKMNDQPDEIKTLIQQDKIRIDASTKLSSISDLKKRVDLAKAVAGLSAEDTRNIINYSKKHSKLTSEECKKAIEDKKAKKSQIKLIKIPLKNSDYNAFLKISKKKGLKLEEAGKQAISEWTLKHSKDQQS
ncbi:MAG: hypothetical protein IAX21_07195 [Candidatus Bathyarchaeota archaeon]|nr:MAG: hypothetical protein IAX21_07195 [Candidatus Bathyarchaeota archaeon]